MSIHHNVIWLVCVHKTSQKQSLYQSITTPYTGYVLSLSTVHCSCSSEFKILTIKFQSVLILSAKPSRNMARYAEEQTNMVTDTNITQPSSSGTDTLDDATKIHTSPPKTWRDGAVEGENGLLVIWSEAHSTKKNAVKRLRCLDNSSVEKTLHTMIILFSVQWFFLRSFKIWSRLTENW